MLNDKCDEELIKAAGKDLKVVSSFSAGGEVFHTYYEKVHVIVSLTTPSFQLIILPSMH